MTRSSTFTKTIAPKEFAAYRPMLLEQGMPQARIAAIESVLVDGVPVTDAALSVGCTAPAMHKWISEALSVIVPQGWESARVKVSLATYEKLMAKREALTPTVVRNVEQQRSMAARAGKADGPSKS